MSITNKFKSLIERAKGLLDSGPPSPADRTDAVAQDRYDARLYEELMDEAPALRQTVEKMSQTIDYADDLMRDTLMSLWQGDPMIRPESEMADSHLINHAVAHDMHRSDALAQARTFTQHDKYGAAMAALGLSGEVRDHVARHGQALKDKQEAAEQAREEEREALENLRGCLGGMPGGAGGAGDPDPDGAGEGEGAGAPDPNGDPGEISGSASMDLEQAIAAAEAAAQARAEAEQQLKESAAAARRELKQPTERALRDAAEELEEESDLFRSWGVGEGDLKAMDFNERQKLAKMLRGTRLSRHIDLVGRFRLMAAAQRVRKIEYGRDQVVGTELSGDLSRVVMTEFTALAMGDDDLGELMELDFYRRWFENQLLSREFEGQEKVGKGAIIAVWDESGSMNICDGKCVSCGGTNVEDLHMSLDPENGKCRDCGGYAASREAWAKAFALALLDAARTQNRDFVGIGFASFGQQIVWRFPKGKGSTTDVLQMTEHMWNGGTNFEQPVDMAVDILEDEFSESGRMKGDLVFITDDDCMVTPEWLGEYLKRKERLDFRTFGIALGKTNTAGALAAMSDNVRAIEHFSDPSSVRDVFQVL